MNRVIIAGSPRSNGRSAHLAELLFEMCIEEYPEDEVYLAPVSELEIGACIGCGGCSHLSDIEISDENGETHVEQRHHCVFDDDMTEVYDLLLAADELIVVSPVYFSGAPAPMKALLDRMQPFFFQWLDERAAGGGELLEKRPAVLHIVGEGGDSNGYVPLVGEVRSALAVAGFELERAFDWVGKIDAEGEILEDAVEYALPPLGVPLATLPQVDDEESDDGPMAEPTVEPTVETSPAAKKTRPRLDLSSPAKDAKPAKPAKVAKSDKPAKSAKDAKSAKPAKSAKTDKPKSAGGAKRQSAPKGVSSSKGKGAPKTSSAKRQSAPKSTAKTKSAPKGKRRG